MPKGKGEKRRIKDTASPTSPHTSHSPPRKQSRSEEMEALTKSVNLMIEELKTDKEERKKEFQDIKNLLAEKQNAWEEGWKQERQARVRLEQRLDRLENAERRRNLIMSNYVASESSGRKLATEIEGLFKEKAKEIVKVESVSRFRTDNGDRFIIRLRDLEDKFQLLRKKKDMVVVRDGKNVPIYIDEDLSREDRLVQKKAREECKPLREMGKEAKVGHRRIYVDGKERRWNNDEGVFQQWQKKGKGDQD